MTVTIAHTLDDACAALAADPEALVLAGGTDLMVEVNRGDRSIGNVVAIDRVRELRGWTREGDVLRIGAGMTYAEMADPEFAAIVPALVQAARTIGSPQIRATGTIGGNVATASPAGDMLPVLVAWTPSSSSGPPTAGATSHSTSSWSASRPTPWIPAN